MNHAVLARRFLLSLLAGLVLCTALGLHGSSVVMWSVVLREEETAGALLLGKPQPVRSDEWLVWTPSALAQAEHEPPWPVENAVLGAGRSPQLMSLPVRHFTMLFRPQLWGFFLFDFAHGYAWLWSVKVFGLLGAMFLLIRRLADGDFWMGLLGSGWIFLSGYVQWWFSCPPMLPEMLASWAIGIWCVLRIFDGPPRGVALAATTGLVFAAVNFALCMYPPFQIPLAWVGLAVLGGCVWQRRAEEESRVRWPAAAGWLGLALVGVAAVLVPVFIEMLPTLRMVAETSYPGARRATGGALDLGTLFLGLAGPLLSTAAFPETRVNVCNAANFYPVWIAAALSLATGVAGRPWRLLTPLLGAVLALAVFAICPLPAVIGQATLLRFSTEERCLLPIGIGGILLSVLALKSMPVGACRKRGVVFVFAIGVAIFALVSAAEASPVFFQPWRLAVTAALAVALFGLYLWPRKRVFAVALFAALAPTSLLVNPLTIGVAPLTDSSAAGVIREIRRVDPQARWLAYEGANLSAFLAAQGVNVLSGSKTVPDLAFYRTLDPDQQALAIYNRYSLGVFQLPTTPNEVRFEQINFCGHRAFIHPTHPALRAAGVRYAVFPRALDPDEMAGLELLRPLPERRMWIYRIAGN